MSDAFQFGVKAAEIMFPPSAPASAPAQRPNPLAFSNAVAAMSQPDPLTGALPQFDTSKGGTPLPPTDYQRGQASVNAWARQGSANDPLAVSLPTRQSLSRAYEMVRALPGGFVEGLKPENNSVTNFAYGVGRFGRNVANAAQNISDFTDNLKRPQKQVGASPEALAAAAAAPKPTFTGTLGEAVKNNPAWLLPAAGLGGLGIYGLYKLMNARSEAKKRRRLTDQAAVAY